MPTLFWAFRLAPWFQMNSTNVARKKTRWKRRNPRSDKSGSTTCMASACYYTTRLLLNIYRYLD